MDERRPAGGENGIEVADENRGENEREEGVQAQADRLKILAVLSPQRAPQIPNVPSLAEILPGYDGKMYLPPWIGLSAPAKTPPEIGQRVSALLEATLKDADTRARVIKAGMVPEFSTAAEFKAKIDFETKAYGEQMRMFNIKIDQQ